MICQKLFDMLHRSSFIPSLAGLKNVYDYFHHYLRHLKYQDEFVRKYNWQCSVWQKQVRMF